MELVRFRIGWADPRAAGMCRFIVAPSPMRTFSIFKLSGDALALFSAFAMALSKVLWMRRADFRGIKRSKSLPATAIRPRSGLATWRNLKGDMRTRRAVAVYRCGSIRYFSAFLV
jgi:hypothetical protein